MLSLPSCAKPPTGRLPPWGLAVAQAPVLVILREAGRPVMITEVARRLLLETPSVTTMVDRLSERGLVERVKDPKDRRKTLVALTRKGRRLVDTVREPGNNNSRKRDVRRA